MFGKLVNLPWKILDKAARVVQDRQDAQMRERHGTGADEDEWSKLPAFDVPPDYDCGDTGIEAEQVVSAAEGWTIVDVRPDGAWADGHPPGAIHMVLGSLPIRLSELPADRRVLVVADDDTARQAARFLRWRGIEDVWHLEGGLAAWKAAGGAVVKGA